MREKVLSEKAFLVSETNSKGIITFANEEFCAVAEYSLDELVGQPHNIVRHQDMPRAAFEDLWNTVKENKVWQGFVKNKSKSGSYYWVYATVYPYENEQGELCYMSCRRKPRNSDIKEIEKMYSNMR